MYPARHVLFSLSRSLPSSGSQRVSLSLALPFPPSPGQSIPRRRRRELALAEFSRLSLRPLPPFSSFLLLVVVVSFYSIYFSLSPFRPRFLRICVRVSASCSSHSISRYVSLSLASFFDGNALFAFIIFFIVHLSMFRVTVFLHTFLLLNICYCLFTSLFFNNFFKRIPK